MFTKKKVESIIHNGVYGIIVGAIVVAWLLPAFDIKGIAPWIGGVVGGVLGLVYGAASGDDD